MRIEVFRHQPPITMMRLFLAAEETSAMDESGIEPLFDLPLCAAAAEQVPAMRRSHPRGGRSPIESSEE